MQHWTSGVRGSLKCLVQYSFQPQRDALRLQRAATQGRSKAQMTTPSCDWEKRREKTQSSQTSASTWERKCAFMWRPTTDAIKCHVNVHKLLTHWLDLPSRRDIKLVLAITWAFIRWWVVFGLFNQLCTASWFPRRAEPYATHSWLRSSCLISPALLSRAVPWHSCHSCSQPL